MNGKILLAFLFLASITLIVAAEIENLGPFVSEEARGEGCREPNEECVPNTPGKLCCESRPCRCDVVGQNCICHLKFFELFG